MPLFAGACVASAAFPTWFLINADVGHMPLAVSFAAGFLGGMLASPPGPNARWRTCLVVLHTPTTSSRAHCTDVHETSHLMNALYWNAKPEHSQGCLCVCCPKFLQDATPQH